MDESIDIWDTDGQPTGRVALKSAAHRNGWFHPTVHIWFYTREGEILLQRRAKDKATFPDLWDVSVAGHIQAGETPALGAVREIHEEIGIEVTSSELNFIGLYRAVHQHPYGLMDCEFHHIYLCELKYKVSELLLQETEVADLRLTPKSILEKEICSWNPTERLVPHGRPYYKKITEALGFLL